MASTKEEEGFSCRLLRSGFIYGNRLWSRLPPICAATGFASWSDMGHAVTSNRERIWEPVHVHSRWKIDHIGPGAGTVDKRYYGETDYSNWAFNFLQAGTDKYKHGHHDVFPFWTAWLLDGKSYGHHVGKYLEVRPSHNEHGCEENEVGG